MARSGEDRKGKGDMITIPNTLPLSARHSHSKTLRVESAPSIQCQCQNVGDTLLPTRVIIYRTPVDEGLYICIT